MLTYWLYTTKSRCRDRNRFNTAQLRYRGARYIYTITVHSNGDTRLWRLDTVLPDPDELPDLHLAPRENKERFPAFDTSHLTTRQARYKHPKSFVFVSKKIFLRCDRQSKFLHSDLFVIDFEILFDLVNDSHQIYIFPDRKASKKNAVSIFKNIVSIFKDILKNHMV